MPCPRCSWSDFDGTAGACERCGYTPGGVAVDPDLPVALDEAARAELAEWFTIEAVQSSDPHSVLYTAVDHALRKRVLLRAIALEPLTRAGLADTLRDAVAAASTLNHPHIHPVLGTGTTASVAWVTMPMVRGAPLTQVLARRGPLGVDETQRLLEQVASALYHAHRRGVIHGAVHPSNLLVDDEGWVLLSGVGVGRVLVALALLSPDAAARASVEPLAPEDHAGLRPTPAIDQHGLAMTAAACLGGMDVLRQVESDAARTILERLTARGATAPLAPPLLTVLQRALRPVPDERYRTVLEFVAALGDGEAVTRPAAAAPPAAPYEGEQEVVFVEERQRRGFVGLAARSAIVVALAAAGIYRLMSAESGPPSLPAAVVLGPKGADAAQGASPAVPAPSPEESLRRLWDSLTVASAGGEAARGEQGATPSPADSSARAAGDSSPDDPSPDDQAATSPTRDEVAPTPPRRTPDPPPARRRPPATRTTPRPSAEPVEAPPPSPGRLFVSSRPWGQLYLDGQLVGNTPIANVTLTPGTHRIRIVREGFRPYEQDVTVIAGEHVRLVDLVLLRNSP